MVMPARLGCRSARSGSTAATVSSRASLPSSMSCRMTVAMKVLLMLPMRKWSSSAAGRFPATSARPYACW